VSRVQFRLFALLLAMLLLVPFGDAIAKKPIAPGALTLPMAGTIRDAAGVVVAAYTGTVTINRFANQDNQLVAVGIASGTVFNAAGQVVKSGIQTVVLRVSTGVVTAGLAIPPSAEPRFVPASSIQATGGRFIRTQAQTCGILHLDLGAQNINLLGFMVTLSPITLDISGDSAGPLGALVCEIVALLGNVAAVVGLLNDLLGLLTGLLGGVVGGIGGLGI
jgi:hypothetical protein